MRFKKLVEEVGSRVPENPPSHIFLFHGTSTSKLEKLQTVGLQLPTGNVLEYMKKLAEEFLLAAGYTEAHKRAAGIEGLPVDIQSVLADYVVHTRIKYSAINSLEEDHLLYMTPDFATASYYAERFARYGSEARQEAFEAASNFLRMTGWLGNIPVPAPEGKPLVIGAVVPVEATNLGEEWFNRYRYYQHLVSIGDLDINPSIGYGVEHYQTAMMYESAEYLKDKEILVSRSIPASHLFFGSIESFLYKGRMSEFLYRVVPW